MLDVFWDEFFDSYLNGPETLSPAGRKISAEPTRSGDVCDFDQSENQITVRFMKMDPSRTYEHDHTHFELLYLYKGKCVQTINGQKISMSSDDLCLISPSDKSSFEVEEKSLLFFISLHQSLLETPFFYLLENTLLQAYFANSLFSPEKNQTFLYFPYSRNSKASGLSRVLIREYLEQDIYYEKYVEATLFSLFIELARSYKQTLEENVSSDPEFFNIMVYINKNKSTVTLESAAKELGYNPNYLSGLIKKNTGRTFSENLLDAKLMEASFLLKNTEIKTDKVIKKVGFYDNSHFHKAFKKKYGVTPAVYRKSYNKNLTLLTE